MGMLFPPDYRWSKRKDLQLIRARAEQLRRELQAEERRKARHSARKKPRTTAVQDDLFGPLEKQAA